MRHVLVKAGNAKLMTADLMTADLMTTLVEHSTGNCRTLMGMAGELLAIGAQREVKQLDKKLYFEVFAAPPPAEKLKVAQSRRR